MGSAAIAKKAETASVDKADEWGDVTVRPMTDDKGAKLKPLPA